jgi:hypothetical protein
MPTEAKSNCKDWSAIHDFMPPAPPRLRVRGKCTFPTPGYKVSFRHHHPQGINPLILILDKTVVAPTGIEPQIVTTIDVEYQEQTAQHYTEVEILPDQARIKVEEVS